MTTKAFLEALSLLLQVAQLILKAEGGKNATERLRRHRDRLEREQHCRDRAARIAADRRAGR